MEKRLIDAVAYCRELILERNYPGRPREFMDAIEVAIADLGDMPTVDAVELPCKIGDTVYIVIEADEIPHFVDPGEVFAIGIDENKIMWISVRYESGLKYYHAADDIGKTVFLTREAAEEALKGEQHD